MIGTKKRVELSSPAARGILLNETNQSRRGVKTAGPNQNKTDLGSKVMERLNGARRTVLPSLDDVHLSA